MSLRIGPKVDPNIIISDDFIASLVNAGARPEFIRVIKIRNERILNPNASLWQKIKWSMELWWIKNFL